MTIACVSVPNLTLRLEVQQRPELDGTPLILRTDGSRALVAAVAPEAELAGVRPGMTLREASALCPEAIVVEPNPVRDERCFAQIVARLERLSPLVEPEGFDTCYVDLTGLDRRLGDPASAAERLLRAVPPLLRPRLGLGPGKFVARLAARQAVPGGWLIVAPEEERRFLARQPVAQLPLSIETIRQLERLGLHTLGELAALRRSAVEARFGAAGGRAWLLACGVDEEPVRSRPREERVVEQLALPAPVTNQEALLVALRQVIARAFGRPELRRRQVGQVRVLGVLAGERSWEHRLTLREPADSTRLLEALRHRLQGLTLPGPLESLTLELSGLTVETAHQGLLLDARAERAGRLNRATDYLRQRYGVSPLVQIVRVEPWSRIPERRYALISSAP